MSLKPSSFALTVGPLLFNWSADEFSDFYARIADEAPVDRVTIGEIVCSKRTPFYADRIPAAIERLQRGGKQVVLSSLAMVTLEREKRGARELFDQDLLEVEINDLTLMNWVKPEMAFSIGPLVNVYNEATLAYLARQGARRFCLPPELPFASVEVLAAAAAASGAEIELWAYGRIPLAISGRCTHARVHGLSKDSCQFVCAKDADGLAVRTLDGANFLAVNGVQTLSHISGALIGDLDRLARAGVTSLRLSPHTGDFIGVTRAFAEVASGALSAKEGLARLRQSAPEAAFSNGFLFGDCGAAALHER
ncbi:U32 family peptidase [uncultured Rhodoblastus sp.]|uniref:ubiquinone anaerobic biosynthesis protein UbiV n=1 Tax=uncultured Rhodoblastus sp. TaxID=543037 RepID=UPI0025FB11F2|nr:U32 family peptidase [uncultured Rhodoblastus sp.]